MTKYILTRTLRSLLTVASVFVTVFMLLRLMPLSGYFPQEILKETDEATRMTLSLDNDLNGPINIAPNYKVQDCRAAFKECYPFY